MAIGGMGDQVIIENIGAKRIAGADLVLGAKFPYWVWWIEDIQLLAVWAGTTTESVSTTWLGGLGYPVAGTTEVRDALEALSGQRFYDITTGLAEYFSTVNGWSINPPVGEGGGGGDTPTGQLTNYNIGNVPNPADNEFIALLDGIPIYGIAGVWNYVSNNSPITLPTQGIHHLILTIGNSHTSGRADALVTDTFDSRVFNYGSANTIVAPIGAILDHDDSNQDPTDFSPDLPFSDAYLAANPTLANLTFVPYAESASGFSTIWAPTGTPNQLSVAVGRFNAAKALIESEGSTVVVAGVLWHNANPDYNNMTWDSHRIAIDAFINYIRANLDGGADVPIVIGGGMTKTQLDTRLLSDTRFTANLNGAEKRHAGVASYDVINPQHGIFSGLPLQVLADGIHADRAGDIVKGRDLRYPALVRAALNTNPHVPFVTLSFWADFHTLIDFRTGSGIDISGNSNDLTHTATSEPLIRFEGTTQGLVYDRPGGSGRAWVMNAFPTGSYTKAIFIKLDSYSSMGFMQDSANAIAANSHRFGLVTSGGDLIAGHGANTQLVTPSAQIGLGTFKLVTLVYDETAASFTMYINGTAVASAELVPTNLVEDTFLGVANSSEANPLVGDMLMASIIPRALTSTEVSELSQACNSLIL